MGLSNGAMMTSVLACIRADRFAAFAPVAGLTDLRRVPARRPVSILAFHGTADPILIFNGGVGDLSVISGGDATRPVERARGRPRRRGLPRQRPGRGPRPLGCDPGSTDEQVTDEIIGRTWACPEGRS